MRHLKVGQQLFMVRRLPHMVKNEFYNATVVKVGRVYFYVDAFPTLRFRRDDMTCANGGKIVLCYLNKEAWHTAKRIDEKWAKIRDECRKIIRNDNPVMPEKEINALLYYMCCANLTRQMNERV